MRSALRLAAFIAALAPIPVSAASALLPSSTTNQTYVGDRVEIRSPVDGDLVIAAGTVRVLSSVSGDVLIVAGTVDLEADVEGDVRIAAGSVRLRSIIGGEALIAAGEVLLGPTAAVGADLRVSAGSFVHTGRVEHQVYASTGTYELDGRIAGSAIIETGELALGSSASVAGDFTYTASRPADDALREKVRGVVTYTRPAAVTAGTVIRDILSELNFTWIVALAFLSFFLTWMFPTLADRAIHAVQTRPLITYASGVLGVLAVFPILLGFATIIGIPIAFLLLSGWIAIVLSTKSLVALFATWWTLRALRLPHTLITQLLGAFVMLLALDTIGALPVVNILVWLVLYPFAIGATIRAIPSVITIHGRRSRA